MSTGTTDFIEDACDMLDKNDESYIVVCWDGKNIKSYAAIEERHLRAARKMLKNKEWQNILLQHLLSRINE
jgi:hypothetical protein